MTTKQDRLLSKYTDRTRLQAMVSAMHEAARAEDEQKRTDNRALVLTLENNRRIQILSCWGGDQC